MKVLQNTLFLSVLLAAMFISIVVLSIFSSNKAAILSSYEKEIQKLEQENRELSSIIISKSSLKQLSSKASELGLGASKDVLYLNKDISVAQVH